MRERLLLTCVLGMLMVLLPWASSAQTPDSLEQRIDLLRQRIASYQENISLRRIYLTEAGTSANTPNAYGGSLGSLGIGVGFQRPRGGGPGIEGLDGIAGISIGLGDPRRWAGVAVGVVILDVSAFKRASASLKVTRLIKHDLSEALADLSVAAGVQNIVLWSNTEPPSDAPTSVYGVASAKLKLRARSSKPFSRLYFSVGIGNGRFSLDPEIGTEPQTGNKKVGLFSNVAIKAFAPLHLFAEWTGQEVIVGTSLAPFRDFPLVLTFALADITGQVVGEGVRAMMALGVGLPLQNINL